jgi:hypothetical protein
VCLGVCFNLIFLGVFTIELPGFFLTVVFLSNFLSGDFFGSFSVYLNLFPRETFKLPLKDAPLDILDSAESFPFFEVTADPVLLTFLRFLGV